MTILATLLEQEKISTIQQLTKSYAETYLILSKFYLDLSNKSFQKKDTTNCIVFLYGSANYLILGAKWVGYEISDGTRNTRKSILNLSNAINSRSEVNQIELKKVLDFIQKKMKKFDAKMTSMKTE
jgi:hypothetical protein